MEGSPVPTAINTGTKTVVENTGKGIKVFNDASNQSLLDHYIAFFCVTLLWKYLDLEAWKNKARASRVKKIIIINKGICQAREHYWRNSVCSLSRGEKTKVLRIRKGVSLWLCLSGIENTWMAHNMSRNRSCLTK